MSADFRRIGKYELRERLASGGQGEVWKAFDLQLRRFVAIKQLNAHSQADPDFVARFEREAQFIAALRHPNIVRIHDFQFVRTPDADVPTAYMIMDYIEGPTLADYIRNTARKGMVPSGTDIVSIFTSVSLALDYAHQKGMIHRDIKPANIMLDKRNPNGKTMGEPILMDFGIAKLQGGDADTTRALGTPLYVSPEQAQGLAGGPRSDLYSLGIVLYEIMTGVTPFRDASPMMLLMRHYQDIPSPPALINPDISPAVSRVILQSIAKDPQARFPSASAMTRALAEAFNISSPSELWKVAVPTSEQDAPNFIGHAAGMASQAASASYAPANSRSAAPLIFTSPTNNTQTPVGGGYETPSALSPVPPQSPKRSKRNLVIASIVLLVLLGIGIASYALLGPKSTGPSTSSVGHLHFLNHSPGGRLDMVQITVQDLQAAPAGKSYYAWFETHDDTIPPIHWPFTVHNGSLVPSSYINSNLFTAQPYRFLITLQSEDSIAPILDLNARLYYALLPQTPSGKNTTFDILACPQNTSNQACS